MCIRDSYEAMDYKAAQACLDRRAAAGWVLKKVHLNVLARFEPCEGRSHFVDLDLRRTLDETDPDYLQLCADAGWEKVQSLRGMLLFRSRPGTHPAPIQSDPGTVSYTHLDVYKRQVFDTGQSLL